MKPRKQAGGPGAAPVPADRGPVPAERPAAEAADGPFRALFETALDAMCIFDDTGRILDANPAAGRLYGVPAAQLRQHNWRESLFDAEGAAFHALVERFHAEGRAQDTLQIRRADGSLRHVEFSATAHFLPGRHLAVVRDVTARVEAEALVRERARGQAAVAAFGQRALAACDLPALRDEAAALVAATLGVDFCAVLELEPDGAHLRLSAGVGVPASRLGGADLEVSPATPAGYTLQTGTPVLIEDLAQAPDFPPPPWVQALGLTSIITVIIAGPRRPQGVLGVYSRARRRFSDDDVHFLQAIANVLGAALERQQADDAIRRSEQRFATVFHASPEAISISRLAGGVVIDVNESWERMFGQPRAAVQGQAAAVDALWCDPAERARLFEQVRRQGVVRDFEFAFHGPSHDVRAGLVSAETIEVDGEACALLLIHDVTERRRAEQALRQSEQRFAKAFRSSPDGFIIARLNDGRLLEANDSWLRIFGYSRAEVVGRTDLELNLWVDPADREALAARLRARGYVRDLEFRIRKKTGAIRRTLASVELVDLDGEPCMLGIFRDITERVEAEAALRRSEERFAKAFHAGPDAFMIFRRGDGLIVDVNDSWERLTGYARAEAVGGSWRALNLWADPQQPEQLGVEMSRAGRVRDIEFDFYPRSGELRQGLLSAELLEIDGVPHVLSIIRDITESKRAADAFQRQYDFTTAITGSLGEGVYALDLEGRVTFANPAATAMLGWTEAELRDRPMHDLIHFQRADGTPLPASECPVHGVAAPGDRVVVDDDVYTRKDGTIFPVAYTSAAITTGGQVIGQVVAFRDITERNMMESRARAAERLGALGRVAAGVAHEFNNILAGMMGRLDLLALTVHDPEAVEILRLLQQTVDDGVAMVSRIQAFARLRDAGAMTAVPVSDLVNDVVSLTHPRWHARPAVAGGSITLRTQVDEGLLVQGNPTKLREVLTNLIFNAVDALPRGGLIQITAEARDGAVALVVRDTGAGMDAATQARIFEPFFTTKVTGSGLGLAVVKDIVESHGGAIRVVSQVGGGTAFTITLPAAAAPGAVPAPPAPPPRQGRARILAVDDDPGLADMLRAMLAVGGHTVTVATNGAEAVRLFEQQSFDVVCTDLGMPGMNGWEVARHVRARAPQTPVILITGWGAALDPDELAAGTVDFVLPKPYRVVQVQEIVAQALARRAAGDPG
jgi:PAS domain S-box-containing protein